MQLVMTDMVINDLNTYRENCMCGFSSPAYKNLYSNIIQGIIDYLKVVSINVNIETGEILDEQV